VNQGGEATAACSTEKSCELLRQLTWCASISDLSFLLWPLTTSILSTRSLALASSSLFTSSSPWIDHWSSFFPFCTVFISRILPTRAWV